MKYQADQDDDDEFEYEDHGLFIVPIRRASRCTKCGSPNLNDDGVCPECTMAAAEAAIDMEEDR